MTIETFQGSPQKSPEFALYRKLTEENDSGNLPETNKKHGINMANYRFAIIDVFLEGGTNPEFELLFWSEAAQAFVLAEPAVKWTCDPPPGQIGCQNLVEVAGRIIFIAVNTNNEDPGDKATISVAGYGLDSTL